MTNSDPAAPDGGSASPVPGDTNTLAAMLREALQTLFLALVVFALLRQVMQNYRIEGPSMQPNLWEGQFLIVNRLAYRTAEIQRGDIVVLNHPTAARHDLIKRVVGLPGEHLELIRGQVWIDGQPIDEPYVQEPSLYSQAAVTIPSDHVFVMGDNRNNSNDSRRWGSLSIRSIVGKAVFCYWPPSQWGAVARQADVATPDV